MTAELTDDWTVVQRADKMALKLVDQKAALSAGKTADC